MLHTHPKNVAQRCRKLNWPVGPDLALSEIGGIETADRKKNQPAYPHAYLIWYEIVSAMLMDYTFLVILGLSTKLHHRFTLKSKILLRGVGTEAGLAW